MPMTYIIGDWTIEGEKPGTPVTPGNAKIAASKLNQLMQSKKDNFKAFTNKEAAIHYAEKNGLVVHGVFLPPAFYNMLNKENANEGGFEYQKLSLPTKFENNEQIVANKKQILDAASEFETLRIGRRGGSDAIITDFFNSVAAANHFKTADNTQNSQPSLGEILNINAVAYYDKNHVYGENDDPALRGKVDSIPERDIRSNTVSPEVKLITKFYYGNEKEKKQAVKEYYINQFDAKLAAYDAVGHINTLNDRLNPERPRRMPIDSDQKNPLQRIRHELNYTAAQKNPLDVIISNKEDKDRIYSELKKELTNYATIQQLDAKVKNVLTEYQKQHTTILSSKVKKFVDEFTREKELLLKSDLNFEEIILNLVRKLEVKFEEVTKSRSVSFFNDPKNQNDHHFTRLIGLVLNGIYQDPKLATIITSSNSSKEKLHFKDLKNLEPSPKYSEEIRNWGPKHP